MMLKLGALILAKQLIERLQEIQAIMGKQAQAEQLIQQGIKQREREDIEAAKQSFQQALNLYQEIDDQKGELKVLSELSNIYMYLKDFPKVIEISKDALFLSQKLDESVEKSWSLSNLQFAYLEQKYYKKLIEYGQLLLQVTQD